MYLSEFNIANDLLDVALGGLDGGWPCVPETFAGDAFNDSGELGGWDCAAGEAFGVGRPMLECAGDPA